MPTVFALLLLWKGLLDLTYHRCLVAAMDFGRNCPTAMCHSITSAAAAPKTQQEPPVSKDDQKSPPSAQQVAY